MLFLIFCMRNSLKDYGNISQIGIPKIYFKLIKKIRKLPWKNPKSFKLCGESEQPWNHD